jgi:uncharacterized protein (DUF362 family)
VSTKATSYTQNAVDEAVFRALDTLYNDVNDKTGSVVIKPNLCYYWDYSTGETTDPKVVSAVIDWVRRRIGKSVHIYVAEADASAMRTKYAFRILGYEKLCQEKNVELINLSVGEIVSRDAVVAGKEIVLPVNKILLDADLMISVPTMKYNRTVGFTCALKNMFGAIAKPRKYVYHKELHRVIVGINKIITTDIVLVDGMIAAGKTPKKMGVIITGDDALATDVVVAEAMGYKPHRIPYLKLAMKERVGNIDSINLIANPTTLDEIKREYPAPNYLLQRLLWKLELKLLRTYAKLVGDVIPPILEE